MDAPHEDDEDREVYRLQTADGDVVVFYRGPHSFDIAHPWGEPVAFVGTANSARLEAEKIARTCETG